MKWYVIIAVLVLGLFIFNGGIQATSTIQRSTLSQCQEERSDHISSGYSCGQCTEKDWILDTKVYFVKCEGSGKVSNDVKINRGICTGKTGYIETDKYADMPNKGKVYNCYSESPKLVAEDYCVDTKTLKEYQVYDYVDTGDSYGYRYTTYKSHNYRCEGECKDGQCKGQQLSLLNKPCVNNLDCGISLACQSGKCQVYDADWDGSINDDKLSAITQNPDFVYYINVNDGTGRTWKDFDEQHAKNQIESFVRGFWMLGVVVVAIILFAMRRINFTHVLLIVGILFLYYIFKVMLPTLLAGVRLWGGVI